MQPDTSLKIDKIRIFASVFWIGGAILTLIAALESYQQNKAAQKDNKCDTKYEIERMEKQFQMQMEKLKNKL